jgi:hypothetical protein
VFAGVVDYAIAVEPAAGCAPCLPQPNRPVSTAIKSPPANAAGFQLVAVVRFPVLAPNLSSAYVSWLLIKGISYFLY